MRPNILRILLLFALVFQGIVAVGADVFPDRDVPEHCAGHDSAPGDCVCCPEGGAMNAGCSVQCSATQAPAVMTTQSLCISPVQHAIHSATYVPLNPPPIA